MNPTPAVHVIDTADHAAAVFHPMRLDILRNLVEADSAAGLARRLGRPRQQVNYHLRQLEAEGLVEQVGERRKGNFVERLVRAVARTYVISPAALGELGADPSLVNDQASSAYLVALAARVIREVALQRERAGAVRKKLPTLTIQSDIRFASAEAQGAFAEELAAAVARLIARYHDDAAVGGRRFRLMIGSYPVPATDTTSFAGDESP